MHKAYVEWFHSAHLLSKGAGFAGDHVNLYGKIYQEAFEQYDGIIERAIGLTNNEDCACPSRIAMAVLGILQKYPSPANMPSLNIVTTALQLNKEYCRFLNDLVVDCKSSGQITIGTEDLIAGTCNVVEGYTYLLQQRVKESIGA